MSLFPSIRRWKVSDSKKKRKRVPKIRGQKQLSRKKALARLNGLVEWCTFKIDTKGTTIPEKMKYARIMNNAIKNSTPLLRDADLDALMARLVKVEAELKKRRG